MEKTNTIWVLFENYPQDHENHINTFSTYEKAKEKFDYILSIRKEDGYFYNKEGGNDFMIDENYCSIFESWTTLELFESKLDDFSDFNS